ncbi:helix-turn-helix domain-containing protein [Streptomyces sp. NPDC059010]
MQATSWLYTAWMEDIAQAAGVTRATVYAHFPGEAEIVDALVEHV